MSDPDFKNSFRPSANHECGCFWWAADSTVSFREPWQTAPRQVWSSQDVERRKGAASGSETRHPQLIPSLDGFGASPASGARIVRGSPANHLN
jgi:hypothetical protein